MHVDQFSPNHLFATVLHAPNLIAAATIITSLTVMILNNARLYHHKSVFTFASSEIAPIIICYIFNQLLSNALKLR